MADLRVEIPRKLFHIFAGLMYLIPLYICGNMCVAILSGIATLIATVVFYYRIKNVITYPLWFLIDKLERSENLERFPGRQAVAMNLGIFLSSLIFSTKTLSIVIVTIAVYDGFATIFGLLFGKHKIGFGKWKLKKSYEGFLGGVLMNTLALSFIVPVKEAFIFSLVGGISELFTSSKRLYLDDNLVVPLLTGIFVQFIYPSLTP